MNKEREEQEKQAINELFPKLQKNIEKVNTKLNNFLVYKKSLEKINPAILVNNKIVELGHIFKRKDIGFYSESNLKNIILLQLYALFVTACIKLENAISIDSEVHENLYELSNEDIEIYHSYFDNIMDEYKTACKEIYSYSIEKDIARGIVLRYTDYKDKEIANQMLKNNEAELEKLGYGNLIPIIENGINNTQNELSGDEDNER